MADFTTTALFRFQIANHSTPASEPIYIEHTHPVPKFLTQPSQSQEGSQDFANAFIDTLSIITHQHHSECMSRLTSPCPNCGKLATDALKSPTSYLHLASPMVIINITPWCGSTPCERRIRAHILQTGSRVAKQTREDVHSDDIFGKMDCAVCGKEDAKRCAGCGQVAYCGKECQREAWKGHRRVCVRKKIGSEAINAVGVEMI